MRRKHPKRVRSFDRRLWHRFWRIARPYWFGDQRWAAGGLLALLVLLLLGRTEFNVLFNQQTGEFTSALAAKDSARFWHAMQVFGLALLAAVPLYAFYFFVRDRLGLSWRRWLTADFLRRYFSRRQFYELAGEEALDNPDQRIADDIQAFTQKSMLFLLEMLSAVLTLIAFSSVLWSISKVLVGILVVYAVFGTVMTFGVFGKPMIGLNFQQLRREADFRFGLIRVRENAEAIAFYQGEARESAHLAERFAAVYENYKRLLRRTLGLDFFRYAYTFVPYALPSVVIASRILSGELEVGRAIQAGGAFAAMLSALTVFVDRFETLSQFAAGVERLHQLDRLLDKGMAPPSPDQSFIESVEGTELSLDAVTLETPGTGRRLVEGVTLSVAAQADLVIVGQSGGGKSSLLRAVAGLWRRGSGTIRRPNLSEMLFLPQRPYMIWGSLREQLLYPAVERQVEEAELHDVLQRVNLSTLVERCGGLDSLQDFSKMLSIGEQQRLAIARVLLSTPRYAILDEATSALDAPNEALLYAELKRTKATLISVTHHPGLLQYHAQVLELLGEGRWALHDAAGYGLAPELEEVDDLGSAVVRAKTGQTLKHPPPSARNPR